MGFSPEVGEMLPEIHNITVKDTMIIECSVISKLLIYLARAKSSHLDCSN
jgi:hypothetical protein